MLDNKNVKDTKKLNTGIGNMSSAQQHTKSKTRFMVVTSLSLFVLSLACFISVTKPNLLSHIYEANLPAFFTTTTTTHQPAAGSPSNINNKPSKGTQEQEKSDDMAASKDDSWKNAKNVYEFQAKDIDGNVVQLSKYRGNVLLIVNVACNCGFTGGNYPAMQELHAKYASQGLSVLAFPCNQFGGQEPNPEAEIKEFVKQYKVEFDMFSKVNVNGDAAIPLYKYLKSKVDGTFGSFIKWNFSKFLINRDGIPIKRYAPTVNPRDIEDDIVKLLNEKAQL